MHCILYNPVLKGQYVVFHTVHSRNHIYNLPQSIPAIRSDLGQRQSREKFTEKASRRHFITRQDCRNIGRKIRDFSQHRHADDAISVDRIVRELCSEPKSPILLYKAQGADKPEIELPTNTFIIAIMTEFQAQLFNAFSQKIVCLDSTHCTNQYRFKLVTLMVADEFTNGMYKFIITIGSISQYVILICTLTIILGCPVAWLISDKEDTATLEVFLKAVKQRCPEAGVMTVMTDDG